jgi:hypothetical protein
MKKFVLLAAITFWALPDLAQERAARKQAKWTGTRSWLIMGLESSTTPYINPTTLDSTQTAVYFSGYLNYHHKSNFGARVKTYATPQGDTGFYLTSLTGYYTNYNALITPMIAYSRHIQHNRSSVPYTPIQNEIYGQIRLPLVLFIPGQTWDLDGMRMPVKMLQSLMPLPVFPGFFTGDLIVEKWLSDSVPPCS